MICSPLKRKENFSEYQKCIRLILVDLFLGDTGQKSVFPLILCSSVIALFDWSLLCESVRKNSLVSVVISPLFSSGPSVFHWRFVPSRPYVLAPHHVAFSLTTSDSVLFWFFPKGAGVQVFCLAVLRNQLLYIYFMSPLIYLTPTPPFSFPFFWLGVCFKVFDVYIISH